MNLLPSNQVLEDACNLANEYQYELAVLLDNIGRLDDIVETPYIDNRQEKGAYQCLQQAMRLLDHYIDEIRLQLGDIDNE